MLPQKVVLREEEFRLRLVLRAGGFGTWVWDKASGTTTWDPELEAIFGLPPGGFEGTYDAWLSRLHPEDREDVQRTVTEAVARKGTYEIRHRIVWPDGSVHWIEGLGQVTLGDGGEATGTIGCTRDVTRHVIAEAQLAAAAEAATEAAGRAQLLQSVTAVLARAMSVDEVAGTLALQVDGLLGASGIGIALLGRGGSTLGVAHAFGLGQTPGRDFTKVPITQRTPMTDCVRDGRPVIVTAHELRERYPELADLTEGTGHTLLAALPLQVPGRALGALLLAFEGRTQIHGLDLDLVTAIAGQCSQALDRARLVERLAEVALTLQEGLAAHHLPDLPGYELAAVYEPGGDETEHLGGDWYDVTTTEDGTVVLGIGDVMGRGVSAATTMARIRTAARAYAWVDPTPAVVMRKLDRFVRREAPDDFVTMVYATVDPATGETLMINAGHLPPLSLEAGGHSRLLWAKPGLPLGLAMGDRESQVITLSAGGSLLLFTDGLVERRDQDIDSCLERLQMETEEAPRTGTLAEWLNGFVNRLVAEQPPGDDVTALVIRRMNVYPERAALSPVKEGRDDQRPPAGGAFGLVCH